VAVDGDGVAVDRRVQAGVDAADVVIVVAAVLGELAGEARHRCVDRPREDEGRRGRPGPVAPQG
jgi:hypothetical protein